MAWSDLQVGILEEFAHVRVNDKSSLFGYESGRLVLRWGFRLLDEGAACQHCKPGGKCDVGCYYSVHRKQVQAWQELNRAKVREYNRKSSRERHRRTFVPMFSGQPGACSNCGSTFVRPRNRGKPFQQCETCRTVIRKAKSLERLKAWREKRKGSQNAVG